MRPKRVDPLHLEARHLEHDGVEALVDVVGQGLAEVAADEVRSPCASRSAPTSAVVVLLPLVPPIATMGAGEVIERTASSISPDT